MTFEEYVSARLPALLRYAVMLTGDPYLAEDVVQDAMIQAHRHWRRVQQSDVPDQYVKRILTNAYLMLRRGSWLRRSVLRADVPDVAVADHSESAVVRREIWARLAQLPPRQRAALVLRFYEDLPDAAIADVLDCPVGTVRSYISRALSALRRDLPAPLSTDRGKGRR